MRTGSGGLFSYGDPLSEERGNGLSAYSDPLGEERGSEEGGKGLSAYGEPLATDPERMVSNAATTAGMRTSGVNSRCGKRAADLAIIEPLLASLRYPG